MDVEVRFEWTYSPAECFEQTLDISTDDYTLVLEGGSAMASMSPAFFDKHSDIRDILHEAVRSRLVGVQLLTNEPYTLSRPATTRVRADGTKLKCFEGGVSSSVKLRGRLDHQVLDAEGKVVSNSKRERIEAKRGLTELVARHCQADAPLSSLLGSFDAALRDPENALVHLYEIREALSTCLGDADAVRAATGVSKSDWSRFGQLCNDEPLRQGRHRGRNSTRLRDATVGELDEARRVACALVRGYVDSLERLRTGVLEP